MVVMGPRYTPPGGIVNGRWLALAHVGAFLLGSALWVAALGAAAAGVLFAEGLDPTNPEALGPSTLGMLSTLQALGLAGLAGELALLLPGDRRATFPLGRFTAWWVVGLASGLVVWTLPSWLAERLERWLDTSTLSVLGEGLTSPDLVGRLILAFAVAGVAPVLEEVVFRGYVWRALEVNVGRTAALLGSTLLFCAYHLDPVQSLALLPTAALLGWLRLRSGSLVPSIVAHFANNALGVLLAGVDTELPFAAASAGAVATVCVLVAADLRLERP
jgi:membrane protease YdiL (CAAX protease family)